MDSRGGNDPIEYRVARLHRILAEDPRTAELGVTVTVRGEHVYLSGTVASTQCKQTLSRVLEETDPGTSAYNEVRVVEVGEPAEREELQ